MTIEDFFRLLLRNALLLLVAMLLGGAAGYGFSYTKPETYEAAAVGFVHGATGSGEQAASSDQVEYSKAQFYLPLFNTRAVGQRVKDQLGLQESPDAIASSLTATLDPNAPLVTVTARAGSPQEASDIANAAVVAVGEEAATLGEGSPEEFAPYQVAIAPGAPVSPDRRKYAAAGAALGLLLGLGLSWLRNRNDSRVRTVDDIRTTLAVPSLGVLPEVKDFTRRKKSGLLPQPKSFHAREALRKLRTNLRYVDVDAPPRSIVVTSSAPGEGKSTVAANLARVMAGAGQRTLLIDADLRRPVIAKQFGIDGAVGLTQLIAGAVCADDVTHQIRDSRLSVLPAGQIPPNPSELLGSKRMNELVTELSRSSFVIIDAPPVLAVTDAQLLARHTDGAILVAVPGRTRVEGLTRAVEAIRGVSGKVYGVVMNRASRSRITRVAYGDAEYGYSAYGYASKRYSYGYSKGLPTGPESEVEVADDVLVAPVPAGVVPEDPMDAAALADPNDAPEGSAPTPAPPPRRRAARRIRLDEHDAEHRD